MSEQTPETPLRGYAGETKRERPIYEKGPIGPWGARVEITPIPHVRTSSGTTQFEVAAEWTGPQIAGEPDLGETVQARDLYLTGDQELARAMAIAAVDELRVPRVPDLRALATRFSER